MYNESVVKVNDKREVEVQLMGKTTWINRQGKERKMNCDTDSSYSTRCAFAFTRVSM